MSVHTKSIMNSMEFVMFFASIVGVRLTNPDFRFNKYTFCTVLVISTFLFSGCYSIIINRHDLFLILETLCAWGLVIPSTNKLIISLQQTKKLRSLWNFVLNVYDLNDIPNRSKNLLKSANNTKIVLRAGAVIFLFGFFIFAAYPSYTFLFHGKLTLFIALYIPYVDAGEMFGFGLHIVMQFIMAIYAAAGNISFDLIMALSLSCYRDLVSVLEFQLERLALLYAENPTRKRLLYRKAFLRNLLVQFNDTQEYVNTMNEIFASSIFIQIASSSVAVTVALFSIVANNWVSGYGFVLYSLTQIQVLCFLGTIISTQHQRTCNIIYATPWYLYDPVDKKLLLSLMQMSQNLCEMWIGPLAPLNVETGTDIVRSIFSYYTMLVSFLE